MIDINLLPDIKKEYLKSQRIKRVFIVGSFLITAGFVSVTVLLALFVFGAQKLHLSGVQNDIDDYSKQIDEIPDLDKVVTIQKQLGALPDLHLQKLKAERVIDYLATVTPLNITLSKVIFNLSLETPTIEITGSGPDPISINVFVDTLKNAKFEQDGVDGSLTPFSKVVLQTISVEEEDEATYKIELAYDPVIFKNDITNFKLTIPNITSSVSVQERPVLFQTPVQEEEEVEE